MARVRHSKLVVVKSFGTGAEADIALGILESSGIEAMSQADTAGGMRQHLAWSGLGYRVLVCEEDLAMAREVFNPPPNTDRVVVQTFTTQDEADCAQGVLLSAGISATIQDDSASGWRADVPWTGSGFRVLVHKEDLVAARHLLDQPDETRGKS
jgi:type III secretory pathway lipoprotein EscJ